jgi:ATPase subunit of ABC transporter with duplicated ATPase domains
LTSFEVSPIFVKLIMPGNPATYSYLASLYTQANAKRATMVQSRIKTVEKMDADAPEPVEIDQTWRFSIPCSGPLGRPVISIDDVSFDYTPVKPDGTKKKESEYLLEKVNFGVDLDSRIAILGANGQGKQLGLNLFDVRSLLLLTRDDRRENYSFESCYGEAATA